MGAGGRNRYWRSDRTHAAEDTQAFIVNNGDVDRFRPRAATIHSNRLSQLSDAFTDAWTRLHLAMCGRLAIKRLRNHLVASGKQML